MKEKFFVCDSGLFITYTNACLFDVIRYLHEKFHVNFLITNAVKDETIDYPLHMENKKYSFSAMRIKHYLNEHFIKNINTDGELERERDLFLEITNNLFYIVGKPLTLVHKGEAEIVALAYITGNKNIFMDERTTRLLIEAPMVLKKHLEKEYKINVMVNKENLNKLYEFTKGMKVFRSSELLTVAYELGYFDRFRKDKEKMFESALYAVRYAGTSISFDEIKEIIRMIE